MGAHMSCTSCGFEIAADASICPNCRVAIGSASATPNESSLPENATETREGGQPVGASANPPYALFVALSLGLSLCLSLLAFSAADDWAHGYMQISFIAGMTMVLAIGFMVPMPSIWNRIEMRDPNVSLQERVLMLVIVFLVLFVGTSAIAGRAIGTTGRETGQLLADSEERRTLRKTIAQVRASTEGSITSQIAMYKEIGPAVDRFDVVLHRLEVELPIYDRKFPSRHYSTSTTLRWVLTDLKRNELLKQQIQVAATIESADLPTQQKAWREQMQPLLDAEAEYVPSKY